MNRPSRAEIVATALEALSTADRPTGATFVHERLSAAGLGSSEPTVGRLLREFDRLRYTTPHGKRGRVLTSRGRAELAALRTARTRSSNVTLVADRIRARSLDDVLDVLMARRGVERELARAAAVNATSADLAILRSRFDAIRRGETSEGLHDDLARAAHNRVLESLYRMLTEDPDVRRLLDRLSDEAGKLVDLPFDRRVIDAIAKRDPDAAERAIVAHLDDLITIVKRGAARAARRRRSA